MRVGRGRWWYHAGMVTNPSNVRDTPRTVDDDDVSFFGQAVWRAMVVPLGMMGIYALCGVMTRNASGVGRMHFGVEEGIPLVAWFVVPYLSVDVWLVLAFFLCRDRGALWRLTLALVCGSVLCGAGFLAWPMSPAYADVPASGWCGWVLEAIRTVGYPHNRIPSLHVVVTLLIWPVCVGVRWVPLKVLVHIWFGLMLASVLLTHQHHVMDVAGGMVVAAVAAGVARLVYRKRGGVRSGSRAAELRA